MNLRVSYGLFFCGNEMYNDWCINSLNLCKIVYFVQICIFILPKEITVTMLRGEIRKYFTRMGKIEIT